jgi:hypothetical protein
MRTLVAGRLYWASRGRHLRPGLQLWAAGRHWRILPAPRRRGAGTRVATRRELRRARR